nr:unnamed protein product [Spirometra erinaceieuropaei]
MDWRTSAWITNKRQEHPPQLPSLHPQAHQPYGPIRPHEEHVSSLSFNIEHSFDGGKTFSKKGTLIVSPAKRDAASMTDEQALTTEDLRALKELVDKDSLLSLTVSLDASASAVAITLVAENQTCMSLPPSHDLTLQTVAYVQRPSLGTGPDTLEYLKKLERQREEKLRQEQNDNRSFIAKYWMYIVPAVFFFFILNSVDPNSNENSGSSGR